MIPAGEETEGVYDNEAFAADEEPDETQRKSSKIIQDAKQVSSANTQIVVRNSKASGLGGSPSR
jgi:hypothetical protein